MLRLLGRKTSGNVQKVLFGLEELGLAYAREDYGRQFGNTTTTEYLKLNPNAKVPTLVDGDLVVWESNTILRYLAAKAKSPLYPTDLAERTHIERWMDWLLAQLNTPYVAVFIDSKKPPAERRADFADQVTEMGRLLQILDGALAEREWVALPYITLADIALGPIVARCLDAPVDRPALPKLTAWRARIAARPAFAKATAA